MASQLNTESVGPIEGLRVIEVGDLAEVAGKLLADAGADVIRVEPRQGARSRHIGPYVNERPDTNHSLRFASANTSKRSVTLDFEREESVSIWSALVARTEVVLDGTGSSTLDDAGIGADHFRTLQPGLIWCSITPFGLNGHWQD